MYVGQTVKTLSSRWKAHLTSKRCRALSSAIALYGKENFEIKVIEQYGTIQELNSAEIYFINKFNTLAPNGYNLRSGGENGLHSLESKIVMSEKAKKRPPKSEEHKRKISESKTGIKTGPRSQQTKKNMSNSKKGVPLSDQHKLQLSKSKSHKKTKVIAIKIENNQRFEFESLSFASKTLNIPTSAIRNILKLKKKTYLGYTFEYGEKNVSSQS